MKGRKRELNETLKKMIQISKILRTEISEFGGAPAPLMKIASELLKSTGSVKDATEKIKSDKKGIKKMYNNAVATIAAKRAAKRAAKSNMINTYQCYLDNNHGHGDKNTFRTDHLEFYETNDRKIIITNSPYMVNDNDNQKLISDGWIKIYANSATTYIKILDKLI